MKSPCNGTCHQEDGICVGCLRTLKEIEDWRTMSKEDKIKVYQNIDLRKIEIKKKEV
jgi:predicted Fe-S protein YdhL (DUF1289 family)